MGHYQESIQLSTIALNNGAIKVENLSKKYGSLTAIDSLNLVVQPGEFVSIVGPSGCGKSTLLRMLAGLTQPTQGQVFLDGKPVVGPRRDVGVVFQTPLLFEWRTIIENVLLPIDVQKLSRTKYASSANELLKLVGLEGFEKHYPKQLSGGMQQRVGIARALVHEPSMLLMDEPFGALDAMTREKMNVELKRIWDSKNKTIIFITHSIPEAVFLGERVVVMTSRPGRLAEVIPIDLPRLRPLEIMNTEKFGEYVKRIRTYFGSEGGID